MLHLKIALVLLIGAYVLHAGFTQYYEDGYWRVISPILALVIAALFLAFLLRAAWAWRSGGSTVIALTAINLVFLPEPRHFGDYLWFARLLIGAEVTLLAIVGGFMLHPSTRRWFHERSAS
jgi:hypothetical protein